MSLYAQMLQDSPVAYWPLDEASGTQARDASGNGRHGTYTGGVTLGAAGPFGLRAADLDGTTGYVDCGDNAAFSPTNLTVEGWVNRDNLTGVSGILIGKVGPALGEWMIDSYAQAAMYNTGGSVYSAANDVGNPLPALVWNHLAMTFDGTTLRLYRNGVQTGSSTTLSGTKQGDTTDSVTLGRRQYAASPYYIDGRIAHCAIYSTALAADRVKSHYVAGLRSGVSGGGYS